MRIVASIVRDASARPRVGAAIMDSSSGTTIHAVLAVVGHHSPQFQRRLLLPLFLCRMAHLTATCPNASTLAFLGAGLTLATLPVVSLTATASAFQVALGTSGSVRRGTDGQQLHISAARLVSQTDVTLENLCPQVERNPILLGVLVFFAANQGCIAQAIAAWVRPARICEVEVRAQMIWILS